MSVRRIMISLAVIVVGLFATFLVPRFTGKMASDKHRDSSLSASEAEVLFSSCKIYSLYSGHQQNDPDVYIKTGEYEEIKSEINGEKYTYSREKTVPATLPNGLSGSDLAKKYEAKCGPVPTIAE